MLVGGDGGPEVDPNSEKLVTETRRRNHSYRAQLKPPCRAALAKLA